MTVNEKAIDAVKQRWTWKSMHWPDLDSDQITAVLEAAMPHIREQIAQDIERGELSGGVIFGCPLCPDVWESEPTCAHYPTFERAARIVRGKA